MDLKESLLIDIVRKSKKNHDILNKYFNPRNQKCFGCMIISSMKLKDVCALKNIDLNNLVSQLDS